MKLVTMVFLRRDNQILLAMKKRGFGAGKWNGAGGKVEPDETIEQAAIRECQEELGVTPQNLTKVGYLQFFMPDDPGFEHQAHVFMASSWEGEPIETEEMQPEWFDLDQIPYEKMWADDSIWMPHLLGGDMFEMWASVSDTEVLEYELRLVKEVKGGNIRGTFEKAE